MMDINETQGTSTTVLQPKTTSLEPKRNTNHIPELMIPTFEVSSTTNDNDDQLQSMTIISPDSLGATTKRTMETMDTMDSSSTVVSVSITKPNSNRDCSSSPPSDSYMDHHDDSTASSPTNPSAPLTSPSKKVRNRTHTRSPPPPPPPFSRLTRNADNDLLLSVPPPSTLSKRDRAVSLDRANYQKHSHNNDDESDDDDDDDNDDDDDDNDDKSSCSIDSSDGEGSYFSEHLPSPPRRRTESIGSHNPRLLPPGAARSTSMNHTQQHRSHSHHTRSNHRSLHMPSLPTNYSISHESDLSLSSSSSEGESMADTLERSYALNRTQSAPTHGDTTTTRGETISDSNHSNHTLEDVLDNLSNRDSCDKLNIIDAPLEDNDYSYPNHSSTNRRFPTTSSLVSSSSEDIERKTKHSHGSGHGSGSGNATNGRQHRRQSSYRSVGSLTSAGSHLLSNNKQSDGVNVDNISMDDNCKPPELVSFTGSSSSSLDHGKQYHSKSSSSSSSSKRITLDHRVPRNKSYLENTSYNTKPQVQSQPPPPQIQQQQQQVQHVSSLSIDQANAWVSGIVRADSYVSSSNGNITSEQEISPDRKSKNFGESASISNSSRHSKSNSSLLSRNNSGIFVYSEDETDESTVYRKLSNNETVNGGTPSHESLSASVSVVSISNNQPHTNQQSLLNTRERSFGQDLTNADSIEPSSRNSIINPTPGRGSGVINPNQRVSSLSSLDKGLWGDDRTSRTETLSRQHSPMDSISSNSMMNYRVYWKRWLMLGYISLLNLLSDWTCFSVAPIALMTSTKFGIVNPEHLVTIFLLANTISTATEPILLARLGLRRTIVFGSFLLMCGNVIKSGGIPGIMGGQLEDGENNVWRLYAGFFLVGLSQPMYQCTPSILSSSWFPEKERTLATGVALNSNQLGIGCSFVFGSLLVVTGDDITKYFGLLSTLSTLVFIGCYFQFQDAPPTPPSETARVVRGNSVFPYMSNMKQSIPQYFNRFQVPIVREQGNQFHQGVPFHNGNEQKNHPRARNSSLSAESSGSRSSRNITESETRTNESRSTRRSKRSERRSRGSPTSAFKSITSRSRQRKGSSDGGDPHRNVQRRQRSHGSKSMKSESSRSRRRDASHGLAPSPASGVESTEDLISAISRLEEEANNYGTVAPSTMMPGRVGHHGRRDGDAGYYDTPQRGNDYGYQQQSHPTQYGSNAEMPLGLRAAPPINYYGQPIHMVPEQNPVVPNTPFPNLRHSESPMSGNYYPSPHIPLTSYAPPYDYADAPQPLYPSMADPRFYYQQAQIPNYHQSMHAPYHRPPQAPVYSHSIPRSTSQLPPRDEIDEGAEPVLTHAGSSLGIEIADDQILRSIRACFSRPGFIQTVVAFAVSGIVLNTISTYIDCLLRQGGAGRTTVGIIGGSFQVLVMLSSLIIGRITDKSRAYYCVVIGLLVMGAVALAECAINLEAERSDGLKWMLLILAVFVGPLQPVATELGVDVVYPLSENTVLVVQQLVSNLSSAIFIPFFQVAKNYATQGDDFVRPAYTFSFIVLMAIHVVATVFFATFNGAYKRLEHEQRRKKERSSSKMMKGYLDTSHHSNKHLHLDVSHHSNKYLGDEEQQTLLK